MLRTRTTIAALALLAIGCQPERGPRAIEQGTDHREVWVYMSPREALPAGVYRCYDNGGKPQCVKAELTMALSPSPGFCATHPQ